MGLTPFNQSNRWQGVKRQEEQTPVETKEWSMRARARLGVETEMRVDSYGEDPKINSEMIN